MQQPRTRLAIATLAALVSATGATPQCPGEWTAQIDRRDFDAAPRKWARFDDGAGAKLYALGTFERVAGLPARGLAVWDGARWAPLGDGLAVGAGLPGSATSAIVFENRLVVGGNFDRVDGRPALNIAAFDGAAWTSLGHGLFEPFSAGDIRALAVYDDGSGPALYAGGAFQSSGGRAMNNIARWDGAEWQPLEYFATGVNGPINAMIAYDDGAGSRLVVAGAFTEAGGRPVDHLAAWDGDQWTPMGVGLDPVHDLAVFRDELFAVHGARISCWKGETWEDVGGVQLTAGGSLLVHDDGAGEKLYVGAGVRLSPGVELGPPAIWDGAGWSALPDTTAPRNRPIRSMIWHDDGAGPALWMTGGFTFAGPHAARGYAIFDGERMLPIDRAFNGFVHDMLYRREADQDVVYIAGSFTTGAGAPAFNVIRNRAGVWEPVGPGFDKPVHALAEFDDGSGPAVYAGGDFLASGEAEIAGIARWNGEAWEPLPSGLPSAPEQGVRDLAVYDDGSGPALYATGFFDRAGSAFVRHIARWDGSAWSALGNGLDDTGLALAAHDDGTGPKLYVGGVFRRAGGLAGVDANHIAAWDGARWRALGSGANDRVTRLASFEDDGGAHLLAAGQFAVIGGKAIGVTARWDGAAWHDLDGGMSTIGLRSGAGAFQPIELDGERWLALGGGFDTAGTLEADSIALWNSISGWRAIAGVRRDDEVGGVSALALIDSGPKPVLWAAGRFQLAGRARAAGVATWTPACLCYADCDGSGALDFFDFLCFQNQFAAGEPQADCDGSGELDFFDFLCFQNEFAGGCP